MPQSRPSIAIIGAGIGGLAVAAALLQRGLSVRIYEQARQFQRLGAGIQQSPNAMRVHRGLGLEPMLRRMAFEPKSWNNRDWDSGVVRFELPLAPEVEPRYGAPYLLMHRGDLHAALASIVPAALIQRDKRLVDLDQGRGGVTLRFADGSTARADAVIGADGVHSRVREILLGPEAATYTGRVAYRTVFPTALLGGFPVDDCTKWWGPDRHIVIYFVNPRRDEIYFVTSQPEPEEQVESWSARGDLGELRRAFAGFHEQVQRVLAACPEVHKWALFTRAPLPRWTEGRVALLGDSCHPMTPYMAQGAGSALEDAAVLSRCLTEIDGIEDAFRVYEATREERATRIQQTSQLNKWLNERTDPSWVYGYDAWTEPLVVPVRAAAQ